MSATRSPGQRAGLTQAAVVNVAWKLLDEAGAEALTMRALAGRLHVAPNALYSHVASKTALLDLLLDDLLAVVSACPEEVADPVAGLTDLMTATYTVLTDHPDLVPLYLARQGSRGPNAVRLGRIMDGLLTQAGANPLDAAQARRVLIVHTIGSAAFAARAPVEPDSQRPLSREESRNTFITSLRWLLTGITRDRSRDEDRGRDRHDRS